MTYEGNMPATSSTKSHSPRSQTRSTTCAAIASMRSDIASILRGVKLRFTSIRWRVCFGGSMHINTWLDDSCISAGRSAIVMTGTDENVAASLPTSFTSWYFVTAQNPRPPGSSWR